MDDSRFTVFNDVPVASGRCVVYWMQRSQRASSNMALNEAIDQANDLRLPVVCYFALDEEYPLGTSRDYAFLLQGLAGLAPDLERRNVRFVVRREQTVEGIVRLASELRPALVVTDESHLRLGRRRRARAAARLALLGVPLLGVDSDLLVPARSLGRAHYAARTIRPHLQRLWEAYLRDLPEPDARHGGMRDIQTLDPESLPALLAELRIDREVPPVPVMGGRGAGLARLIEFVHGPLERYADNRNNAAFPATSDLSPYLRFGHLDPWTVALSVQRSDAPASSKSSFLDELLVQRELASNFTLYNPRYDSVDGLPSWARETLRAHTSDPRPALYSRRDLEVAGTDDPLWNAAQRELLARGTIHNRVRMYWGKQILTWTASPREAFDWTLYLNNRFALDGRDPVSFANVAWCFGLHDRPWPRRPIFGTVRSMTLSGARRTFDVDAYIERGGRMSSDATVADSYE